MSDLPSEAETPINGAPPTEPLPLLPDPPPPKRHRRPSVRLGEIGDQSAAAAVVSLIPPHESSYARRPKQWKNPPLSPPPSGAPGGGGGRGKSFFSSRTRPLTNLGSGDGETLDIDDNRRLQPLQRRVGGGGGGGGGGGAKRVRTNWGASSKLDEGDARLSGGEEADIAEGEEGWESPIRSADEAGAPPSETDGQDWKERSNNGRCRSVEEGGVRGWLSGLGLERYAPVFEIHEVDEEVLPLLTLEDLKDMGINAVGSRRKIFSAIQKLGKGF